MMKLSRKRLMAALFAILMMITTMLPLGSAAASITMDLSVAEVSWDATLKDADGNVFSAAYGLKAADNPFGYAIGTYVKKMHDYTAKSPNAPAKKSDWVYGRDYIYCFCIEHGIALPNSNSYSGSTDETHGNKYELLSIEQKNLLSLALAYGYPNRTDLETSKDANACYSATQLIIWQITFGFRTSPTELNDKTYPASGYSGTMTEQFTSNPYLKEYYDLILSDMATHYMRPSFTANVPMAAPTYEMDYVNGKYTVTLTDTNQVLSKFKVTASGGATVSINGNQMTISSVQPLNNTVTIKLNRRMPTTTHTTGFLIWSVQGSEESNQDMVSGVPANNDPVPSYLRVATAPGSIHIEKDSEDGKVDGVSFRIVGNGVDQIVNTANEGSCLVNDLRPGTYTVTELTEDQYEETIPQTVTVISNETTTVVFQNVLKRGTLKILKTSEDDKVDNVLFTINGNGVNEKVYTNEVGEIMIPDLLPGKYTVTEQNADYYEPLESQIVTVNYDEVTEVRFHNLLKRGDLIVTKSSEDGVLEGHRFCLSGVSDSGIAIEEIAITDTTGKAYFQHIPIGSNYALEELEPDERYALPEVQKVTIQWNSETHRSFRNVLKRSGLKIVKTSEDGKVAEIPFTVEGNGVQMTLRTDSNGMITLEDLLPGTYTVTEQIESYYEPQKSLVVTVSYDQMVTVDFSNVLKRGNLTVIKTAEDGLTEGVRFRLSGISESGMTIDEIAITDENGKAVFNNIPIGSDYTLEEIEVPSRYVVPAKQQIVIEWNSTTTTEVYNECKRGDLEVIKTAEDGKIEGVKLHLYGISLSGESVDMYAYTDFNGRAMFGNVLIGDTYTVEEVDLPDQYITPASQRVAITDNSVTSIQFHNERKRGAIRVVKTSEDGVIDGIRFHLYGISQSGESIDEYAVTDENGVALFEGILVGDHYFVEETDINEVYVATSAQDVEVEWNQVTQRIFHNALKRGDLHVIKTAEDDVIEGVRFHLHGTSLSGELVDIQAVTDQNGIALFENVLIGDAYVVEEVDVADHYVEPASQTVAIEWDSITQHSFHNKLKRSGVTGLKTDENGNAISGAIFGLFSGENQEYIRENAYMIAESAEDGYFHFGNIPYGTWFVREIQPAVGFVLNSTVHPITITDHNETIEVNLQNRYIRGDIKGFKVNEDGNMIAGAQFGLFQPSVTEFTEETAELITESDSEGKFSFEDIRYGQWLVCELMPATGYVLNESPIEVNIQTEGEIIEIHFENRFIRGDVKGYKVDEDGNPVAGAVFGLFAGDDTEFTEENALLTAESDKDGIFIFEDVRFGKWIVKELKPAVGFLTNDEVYPIDITADGAVIEIEAVNCHVYGMVHTTKVDKDYPDNLLAGAIFEIYMDVDANKEFNEEIDTLVGEMIEYEPGLYVLEGLRFGGYFLYEKRAPINYIKDDAYHYFAIENEGDVIEVENEAGIGFTNCHMLGNIKIVKTSSDGRVEGFAFRIVGENYEAVYRTDSRGEIIISGLRIGSYTISEVEDEWNVDYILPDPIEVEPAYDETLVVRVHNSRKPSDNPQTGDGGSVNLFVAMISFGLCIIGIVMSPTKKKIVMHDGGKL